MRAAGAKLLLALGLLLPLARPGAAQGSAQAVQDRFFTTSDGVRLHYLEAGQGRTLVFVPGWTMPGWIFQRQIAAFAPRFHVVAFDPRAQGDSEVAPGGYEPNRRAADIAELIAQLGPAPVVLAGWSLGVLDSLAYLRGYGDARLAGLVLIDNSVGEEPAPVASRGPRTARHVPREVQMRRFVAGMFHRPQDPEFIEQLAEASLRTPPAAAAALLNYPVPRTVWRDAVYSTRKPILYAVTPRLFAQAENLGAKDPAAETALFPDAGHALFVDEAERFDALLADWLHRRVWP